MTAMADDLGQHGDVAVAALIAEVHTPDRCRDCAAGNCEHGAWAADQLAAHRAARPQTTPTDDRPRPRPDRIARSSR